MRQLSAQRLLDHQVDQLAGHADGLDDRLALKPLGNGFLGGSLHLLAGGVAGDVDAATDLPSTCTTICTVSSMDSARSNSGQAAV